MAWIWRLCITNMKKRGIRTFLTILGVVIGVISIVSLISIGIGAKELIMKNFQGDTLRKIEVCSLEQSNRKDKMLTDKVIEEIAGFDHVEAVYPTISYTTILQVGKYESFVEILGVPREYMESLQLQDGELPKSKGRKLELILGQEARDFFYDESTGALIEEMEEEERPSFVGERGQVIMDIMNGNLVDKRSVNISGMTADEYDYNVYCDMDTLKTYLKRNSEGTIIGQPLDKDGNPYRDWIYGRAYVYVDDSEYVDTVIEKLTNRGFQATSNKEYADSMERILAIAQLVLAGIGMIALLVAVIGISNTMMTAVYDRLKEIGILKVLGCDPDELLYLFLLESGILGAIGGALGVLASYLIGAGINKIAAKMMELNAGEQLAIIPWWLALAAIVFAICLGVIAGYFPARWAAKMRPIEAVSKQ